MSSLQLDTFVVSLAGEIDRLTNHFVFDGYSALASLLKAPLGAMIVLYIILMGYSITRGLIQTPQQELFKFTIRAGLIYMCAMNWDFFSSHVRDLFVTGSESIATTLMQAVHKKASSGSINQGLQNVLNEILTLGGNLFESGNFRKLTPYFAGIMVFFSGAVTVGLAFIEIVIAKLMLSVTLCTAPLFILFTLFEQTKSIFDRWLGVLVGFSLVLIFVSSVVGLCIHLLHWIASGMFTSSEQLSVAIWVPLFIVACLCVMGITQAAAIGKSIGGAVCTSGGAAMVGGFIGSSMGAFVFSKTTLGKSMSIARQGLSASTNLLPKNLGASSKAMFQHMQQNFRRGKS
ncbi:MAG: type IV secretion system protein [Legionellaceae bacterium]|nr:type IV secretion system protein [Legionellaceae bacterium]